MIDETVTPEQATRMWRDKAIAKLHMALTNMSTVSNQHLTPGMRAAKLQDQAYSMVQAVYSDLMDLNK